MSRIGIDVDGVLRDFCGSLVNVIKEKYPHLETIQDHNELKFKLENYL